MTTTNKIDAEVLAEMIADDGECAHCHAPLTETSIVIETSRFVDLRAVASFCGPRCADNHDPTLWEM